MRMRSSMYVSCALGEAEKHLRQEVILTTAGCSATLHWETASLQHGKGCWGPEAT
jgi:hypothetical protein